MATYVNDLRLKEISTGDESGTWGTSTNTNLELISEALGYATQQVFGSDADATTTIADGASDPARAMYFKITSAGSLTATRTCTIAPNTVSRVMFIENATTGSQSIAISQGSGANVTIPTGQTKVIYLDGAGSGAAVVDALSNLDMTGTTTVAELVVNGSTAVTVSKGTTAQRPTGVAGMFRYNTTDSQFEGYTTEWGEIGGGAADLLLNTFTGDGSDVTFTLSGAAIENNTLAYVDGVYQNKSTYAVSGATPAVVTFSEAPANGAAIEIMVATISVTNIGTPSDNTVTTAKIVDGAVTTVKLADDAVTAAKLASDAVVTASIVDDAVTAAKIASDAVVTASIVDDAVTAAKIASEPISVGITSVVTATSLTATVNTHVYVSAATQTITLPASPTIGQRVLITVGNFTDTVVARNGSNIMSSASDFTMDAAYLSIQFIYTDATQGWVMS